MIGKILQDKYKIEKKIGEGGFSTVYRGLHLQLKKPVAIKVLEKAGDRGRFKARFELEAQSGAKLNHPNIVAVFDFGEHNAKPFIVMEYVSGPTVDEWIAKKDLSLRQCCNIARQVCQAMSHAHKQGVIHRDLTLRNVMIDEDETGNRRARVLDFGLAKLIEGPIHTSSGKHAMGTPHFMAPEQYKNLPVDKRTDIFAFGVGLFRMVNGYFPFEAEHPAALMFLVLNESDIKFAAGVPPALQKVILRCLEKNQEDRFADFDELVPALEVLEQECENLSSTSSGSFSGLEAFARRSSKRNPYLNRVMISHPSEFYGRRREVRRIFSRLDAPHPQSISVVGERRIGKSSLLNYIYHKRNRKQNMQSYENAIFVYLDFQRDADYDIPRFIDFLFNMFNYESKSGREYSALERTLDELKNVVQELDGDGRRIIMLMDEFEAITNNKNFDENFFSFLRSLANAYKVAYVTSSHEDLQMLCHAKYIADSPFFNIFSNLPLRPFTRDEAMELIAGPSAHEGVPLEQHAEKILDLAGCFPMYLQMACSAVFEHIVDNPAAEPDWALIRRSFADEVEQHYRAVWDHLEEPAKENLHRMATGKPISKKYQFVNEELERRGYLVGSGGQLELCSSSFRKFVGKQPRSGIAKKSWFGAIFGRDK
jgi:serine/threonine protein kinase